MSQPFTATSPVVTETAEQEIARLRAENVALKANAKPIAKRFGNPTLTDLGNGVSIAIGEKFGLCVYGLGGAKRFPVNLSEMQFKQLAGLMPVIQAWIAQPHVQAELAKRTLKSVK